MDLAPERTSAREIRFKLNEQASADGLNHGVGITVYMQDQSLRDIGALNGEDRISTLSAKRPGKTRLGKILCSIKRHRHTSCFRLNRAILSNREVANWTVSSDAKFTARASGLRKAVWFRFHCPEHQSLARESALRGISKRFFHQLNTNKRDLIPRASTNWCKDARRRLASSLSPVIAQRRLPPDWGWRMRHFASI